MRSLLMLVALCLVPSAVRADSPEYAGVIAGAIAAQEAGDFARARALFAQAHAMEPSARTLRGLGVAAFQAGNPVQAVLELSASLEHPNKPLEGDLRKAVVALLDVARASVAVYHVDCDPAEATLEVDQRAPTLDADGGVLLAPGWHTLTLRANGYAQQFIEVEARPGARESLRALLAAVVAPVEPPRVTPAPARPAADAAPKVERAGDHESTRGTRVAMWTTFSTGAAMAASATVLAVIGYTRARSIEDRCGTQCTDSFVAREREAANLDGLARAVNVTGISALAALGTAAGLWLWQRQDPAPSTRVALQGPGLSCSVAF